MLKYSKVLTSNGSKFWPQGAVFSTSKRAKTLTTITNRKPCGTRKFNLMALNTDPFEKSAPEMNLKLQIEVGQIIFCELNVKQTLPDAQEMANFKR